MNLFHGRLSDGRVRIEGGDWEAPDLAGVPDQDAVAYVRTYEVDLAKTPNGRPAIEAVVRHIRRYGPMVRLEMDRTEDGQMIEAEVPRARFDDLGVDRGDKVYVSPRSARVFPR